MTCTRSCLLLFVMPIVLLAAPSAANAQGEAPPEITSVDVFIARYLGNLTWAGEAVAFNPSTDLAREWDWIYIIVQFTDADLATGEDGDEDQEFYSRLVATWVYDRPAPPEPGPIQGVPPSPGPTQRFIVPWLLMVDPAAQSGVFAYVIEVPRWNGPNIERLRNPTGHPYDVGWEIQIWLSNDADPLKETDEGIAAPVDVEWFDLRAVKSPFFSEANPPAFADAGDNQLVAVGATVTLDASQSFDGTNVGFDALDPTVLSKDTLAATWEWVSGPVAVEPLADAIDPLLARVTLPQTGEYVFRVFVNDGVNTPTSDTVTIEVVNADELPEANLPPVAVIAQPQPVVLGSEITLDGRNSWDPDPADAAKLRFRWRQTNELGGELTREELDEAFQPLSGTRTSADPNDPLYDPDTWGRSTWRSIQTGTFYFRLIVTDPLGATGSDFVAVQVVETSGELVNDDLASQSERLVLGARGQASTTPAAPAPPAAPFGCGGSVLPLAMVPVVLWLARGRWR